MISYPKYSERVQMRSRPKEMPARQLAGADSPWSCRASYERYEEGLVMGPAFWP